MTRIYNLLWTHKITAALIVCVLGIVLYNSFAPPPQHYHDRIADFTAPAFAEAQAEGAPILIDVYATWCPVCKRQGKSLVSLIESKQELEQMRFFRVNIDTQPDVVERFDVQRQSTLIAFRGETEIGRLIAETKKDKIWRLLAAAVKAGSGDEHMH